ncbi:MAG: hypothetical protein AB7S69_14735 [Salinivirgaceae bacterium]|jgi:uncharacterized protein YbaR (Trm112 family)
MESTFICPECRNSINVNDDIVLIAKNDLGQKGIVMLHTTLGNYESKFSSDFTILEGDKVKLLCPICHHSLSHVKNQNLAKFIMINEEGKEYYIIFSQIYGEKCTCKIEEKEVKERYGEHLNRYTDPEWFLWF